MSEKRHTYRYPQGRYEQAKARAEANGTTVSEIIAAALDDYVDGKVTVAIDNPYGTVAEPRADDWRGRSCPDCQRVLPYHGAPHTCFEPVEHAEGGIPSVQDAVAATITAGQRAAEDALVVGPACRTVVDNAPCDCLGFEPQPTSPLRCRCGHVRGVHR